MMKKTIMNTRLAQVMDQGGMSTKELSEEIGVSRTSIKRYRQGTTLPSLTVALLIADALCTHVEYLWFLTPDT